MPTKKPRTMITFNDEKLYKAVDEYRFEHRFRSQNEALMDLINKGNVISSTQFSNIFCHFSILNTKKKKPRKRCVFRAFGGEGGI